jgi:SAM-dependent methyltransferase
MEDAEQAHLRDGFWKKQAMSDWGPLGPDPFVVSFFEEHKSELLEKDRLPRMLDVGCGIGQELAFFAAQGFEVTGIEPVPAMRERARSTLVSAGQSGEILDGESVPLPFEDAQFDIVVGLGVWHHGSWDDAQRGIAEAARVLRRGGYVLLKMRSINDTLTVREQIEDTGYTARDVQGPKKGLIHHYFTEEELLHFGEQYGLECIVKPSEKIVDKQGRRRARWCAAYRKQ